MAGEDVELLVDLDEAGPGPTPAGRRRPRPGRRTLLVAAAAVVALAAAAAVVVLAGPDGVPAVTVGPAPPRNGPDDSPWQETWTGRPQAGVVLTLVARVRRQASGDQPLYVTGVTGPGITELRASRIAVPGDRPVDAAMPVAVDCDRVPARPTAADYRLVLRGGLAVPHTREVPAGSVAGRWAAQTLVACSTWYARRDVTVSAARATVAPGSSVVDLAVQVVNTGGHAVLLTADPERGLGVTASGGLPLRVPAGARTDAHLRVTMDRCDAAAAIAYSDIGRALTSDQLGIVAEAGPAPFASSPFDGSGPGTQRTGVVVGSAARGAVIRAVTQACGGIPDQLAVVVPLGGLGYDEPRRLLTVRLLVGVPPGRVDRVTVVPDAASPGGPPVRAWSAGLAAPAVGRPGPTGQTALQLTYRVQPEDLCPGLPFLPGFVAELSVHAADGPRVVRYSLQVEPSQDRASVARLCPGLALP